VSVHRKERAKTPEAKARTNSELLLAGMGNLLDQVPDGVEATGSITTLEGERPSPPLPFDVWANERASALLTASRLTTVAASALTDEGAPDIEPDPGLEKRARDIDLPPWVKGRYGTSVGRAVHGVLQTIGLADGAGLDEAMLSQCEAEAVAERAADVRALVLQALGAPSVVEAAASPFWREVYVCTPVGERLLEGYIDLLYRGPDGLVVVDYKTAATSNPEALDQRVEGYRSQGASYALMVASATEEIVSRVTFLFLTPDGAIERHLSDLDGSVSKIRELVMAGGEIVTA
ncbi:MAG TPA: PD-(D/E)XK nuclease family protein, partial [Acidimicrobiales bacterium]